LATARQAVALAKEWGVLVSDGARRPHIARLVGAVPEGAWIGDYELHVSRPGSEADQHMKPTAPLSRRSDLPRRPGDDGDLAAYPRFGQSLEGVGGLFQRVGPLQCRGEGARGH
jgi:hypothetical protein